MINSKRKGTVFERCLVMQAMESGLPAQRAYASNGESLGKSKEVDLEIASFGVQAKIRKSFTKDLRELQAYLLIDDVDAVVFRENHGQAFVMMDWFEWLNLVHRAEMSSKRD